MLLAWVVVPVLFFTLWPVKGFQYLLPVSPALAILAGRTLGRPLPLRSRTAGKVTMGALAIATAAAWRSRRGRAGRPSVQHQLLAGSGGVIGGREREDGSRPRAATSRLLAIGPSTRNVLEYYGHRPVSALSVSSIRVTVTRPMPPCSTPT